MLLIKKLETKIKEFHPYEVPEIVSLKIDNVSKRKAIQEKTGFNVTRAIEINEETEEEETSKENNQGRRAAPISTKKEEAPQRRSAPPKYNVVS